MIAQYCSIGALYLGAYEKDGYGTIESYVRPTEFVAFTGIDVSKLPIMFPTNSTTPLPFTSITTQGTGDVDV